MRLDRRNLLRCYGKVISVIIFIYLLFFIFAYAQKTTQQQDKSSRDTKDKMVVGGDEGFFRKYYTRFKGNAYVEKGSTRMLAEVIEYFETNNFAIGRGDVVLKDSKSGINVFGQYSEYYGNSNIIIFYNNPYLVITNDGIFLKGEVLILNQNDESVVSRTNAYMSNANIQMFSDNIIVLSKSNIIRLVRNSKVISSNITIHSDRGVIITSSNKKAKENEISQYIGIGRVLIIGSNFSLSSDNIVINFTNNEVKDYTATGNVVISNTNNIVMAEYFRSEFEGGRDVFHIGMTNVVITNLENGDTVYSDYLFADKNNNYELLSGNATYVIDNGRTRIKAQTIERFLDISITMLNKDVVIDSENISMMSEIGKYDEKMRTIQLIGNPRVVNEDRMGVSANVITININKRQVKIDNGNYGYVIPGM
ncbi:MAG: hypothetical protein RMJ37_06615 [Spirochaetia bacterium]|nr:LptA/OstA family protein [Spirochaetota bacterium]MCX8096870.1 LptA/OstA family protein [Spirochaetota bacterium]MDW8112987.1 hypothetical protein [Spirochaetia bacterium]